LAGHVAHMEEINSYKIVVGKPESKKKTTETYAYMAG